MNKWAGAGDYRGEHIMLAERIPRLAALFRLVADDIERNGLNAGKIEVESDLDTLTLKYTVWVPYRSVKRNQMEENGH